MVTGGALFLLSGEPYYRGRPVSQWAIAYSRKLYPSGTVPLSPSQEGLDALRKMGPEKASTALVHALMQGDSKFYEQYRLIYRGLPGWYQNRFPLKLTHQQKVTLILGSTDFLGLDYQKAMVPFIISYLEKPDINAQVAACQLLTSMPEAGSPAVPALERLSASTELSVAQAAQTALVRIQGKAQ